MIDYDNHVGKSRDAKKLLNKIFNFLLKLLREEHGDVINNSDARYNASGDRDYWLNVTQENFGDIYSVEIKHEYQTKIVYICNIKLNIATDTIKMYLAPKSDLDYKISGIVDYIKSEIEKQSIKK